MPTPDVTADFIMRMRKQIKVIRRLHHNKKLKYRLAGKVVTHIDDLSAPLMHMCREYSKHVADRRLLIGLHETMVEANDAANEAGKHILKVLDDLAGAANEVDPVVRRILSLEAHHFIPATSLKHFPFYRYIFPDTPFDNPGIGMMPAVNLLRLEHQGPMHLITQVANQVGILGGPRIKPLTKSMTTRLNGIAQDAAALAGMNEKQQALHYLYLIERFYDEEYPDVGNGVSLLDQAAERGGLTPGWTARDWIRQLRNTATNIPYP